MYTRRDFFVLAGSFAAIGCGATPEPSPPPPRSAPSPATKAANPSPTCDTVMAKACEASCAVAVNEYDEADIVAQPGARVGDLVRCPVSCVVVHAKPENRVRHDGHDYFVCCQGCAGLFRSDPGRFAS
jgi:YHS domain-containing protein